MTKTLAELSEKMRDIDFCMLTTHGANGAIASRPMSNNREVDYDGDSWFFTYENALMIARSSAIRRSRLPSRARRACSACARSSRRSKARPS